MGPGSGIMALVDFLNLPEIYRSYGDTNVDRLTNPDLYKDAARVPANAFLDTMTFLGDWQVMFLRWQLIMQRQ